MKREEIIKQYEEQLGKLTRKEKNRMIEMLLKQAAAFGGCFKCFGKGYGTQTLFAQTGAGDFEFAEPTTHKLESIVPCSCDRGKQIAKLIGDRLIKKI